MSETVTIEAPPGTTTIELTIKVTVPEVEEPPVDPEEPPVEPEEPTEPTEPEEPDPPSGELSLEYVGGLRIKYGKFGDSRASFGPNTFAIAENGIWLAGHTDDYAVGQYDLIEFGDTEVIEDMPIAGNRIPYRKLPDTPESVTNGMRVIGLYQEEDTLHINVAPYYSGNHGYNALLATADGFSEYLTVPDETMATGWMQPIPENWQDRLGPFLMGYASNLPIIGRLSQGPSLYLWDGEDPRTAELVMNYPEGHSLGPMDHTKDPETGEYHPADPLWNELSRAHVGFILGDDYIVVGSQNGIESGIGYKINGAGGYTTVDPDEKAKNWFWRYSLEDILSAENPYDPRPIEYGPLDAMTTDRASDAAFYENGNLYLMNSRDKWQNQYEWQPVIYKHEVKQ